MVKIKQAICFALILVALTSCKKKESDDCSNCATEESGASSLPGLTFVLNGNSSMITADSAYYKTTSKTIVAYYQGNSHKLVIKTSSQVVGQYSISASNTLTYSENLTVYQATSGNITITDTTGKKLSGDFLTLGNNGGITSVKGKFIRLPKRQ